MVLVPTWKQFGSWTTINKWSFIAAVAGVIGLLLSVGTLALPKAENLNARRQLVFEAAQDLRHNDAWIRSVAIALERHEPIPVGQMRTDALVRLVNREHRQIVKYSYGEEKYIYQEILTLDDLARSVNEFSDAGDVEEFENKSGYTIYDLLFLNEFLEYYIRPTIDETLSNDQKAGLYMSEMPPRVLNTYGLTKVRMKYFVVDGEQIDRFSTYLGLLD